MPQFPILIFEGDQAHTIETEQTYAGWLSRYAFVQAAGGIMRNENGEVLLIFRRGRWDLPKGKVEAGESIEAAALREVEEETGMKAEIIGQQRYYGYHVYGTYGTPMLKETVWFEMRPLPGQSPHPQAEEQISQAVWVPEAEVTEKFKTSYASLQQLWSEVINK
jgi:8-oxo-dGTP pyrophosphatase MutT (NUDIX family)